MDSEIYKIRWKWIGHVLRKEAGDIAKTPLRPTLEGKRKKGSPKEKFSPGLTRYKSKERYARYTIILSYIITRRITSKEMYAGYTIILSCIITRRITLKERYAGTLPYYPALSLAEWDRNKDNSMWC